MLMPLADALAASRSMPPRAEQQGLTVEMVQSQQYVLYNQQGNFLARMDAARLLNFLAFSNLPINTGWRPA